MPALLYLLIFLQPLLTLAWLYRLRGERIFSSTGVLVGGAIALAVLLVSIMALLARRTTMGRKRLARSTILLTTAGLQLAAILLVPPALSEDAVRYRTEGRMWLSGVSPYAVSPADWIRSHPELADDVDRMIAHGDSRAIYPPPAQAYFIAMAWLETQLLPPVPDLPDPPQRLWRERLLELHPVHRLLLFRITLALAAVAVTAILLAMLRRQGKSPWYAVVVGWNPLVVLECGGMIHQDILGALLLLASILMLWDKRITLAALLLALAGGIKPVVLILTPFFIVDAWRSNVGLRRIAFALVAGVALLASYIPAIQYNGGAEGFSESVRAYTQSWEANGSVYEAWKFMGSHKGVAAENRKREARHVATAAMVVTLIVLLTLRSSTVKAALMLPLVMLLFSPVVYPWYLLWILPLVPLVAPRWGWGVLLFSGTITMAHALWDQPDWRLDPWQALLEYIPVYAVIIAEVMRARRAAKTESPQSHPHKS